MKNNIIKSFLLVAIAFFFASCDLNLTPSTSIVKETAFQSVADAEKFSNGLTSLFRSTQYGIYSLTTEVQGDMFNATADYGNRKGSPHRMDDSFTAADYDLRDVWAGTYNFLVNINSFLENVDNVPTTNAAEEAKIKVMKGFAYFYRAYAYQDLVRRYGQNLTAAGSLGVPLVLKFDLVEKPARATVGDVYIQVEKDINEAKTLLAVVPGKVNATTPTIDAVKALEARVKFYQGKYAEAATLAGELISSGKYPLANTAAKMTEEWVNDNGTESILQLYTAKAETAQTNGIFLGYNNTIKRYVPDFIPTTTCLNMYEATDLRYDAWFATLPCRFSANDYNLVLLNKYMGNPALEDAPNRAYKHNPKVFRIAEMYLIRAESLVKTGGDAKSVINVLQAARGASLTDGSMLSIQKEWAKETIGEGFRIDCLRRWKIGYVGRLPQNNVVVMKGDQFDGKVSPANNPKYIWAIPEVDINVNPNLVQNPDW